MQHRYVYSLSHNNAVFYIGCAKDLKERYKGHVYHRQPTEVSKYIFSLLDSGEYPQMNIMYYLPEEEAFKKESELIELFAKSGQYLLNSQWNSRFFRTGDKLFKNATTLRHKIAAIDYKQKYYHYYNSIGGTGPILPVPKLPKGLKY